MAARVLTAHQVLLDYRAKPERTVRRGRLVTKVRQERRGRTGRQDMLAPLAPRDRQDPEVLRDLKATEETGAREVLLGLAESQAPPDHQDCKARRVLPAKLPVRRDHLATLDNPDSQALRD